MNDHQQRFTDLILPHLADAYGLARALTSSRPDAEDVVQDACVHAFRGIDNVTDSSARAWFLTIVHNTACTWLRKNRPAALVSVDNLELIERTHANVPREGVETPETALISKANGIRLEAAIAGLRPMLRETLMLRDVHGLDYREIATVTGVPVGTVMSRLARARNRLAMALASEQF